MSESSAQTSLTGPAGPEQLLGWTEMIMGLPFSLRVRGPVDPVAAGAAVDRVWADLRRDEEIFSTYLASSDISRIDRGELAVAEADPSVAEALEWGERARLISHGAFDVRGTGRLDPSGVVKGWAAERACRHLAALGADFSCNAGGDVLVCARQDARPWAIGLEHPENEQRLMAVLHLHTGAVATSGRAHRGAHIVDGATGRPARGVRQATVIGPELTWCDILATAVVAEGMTQPDTSRWPAGYDILLVNEDGELAASPGVAGLLAPGVPPPPVRFRLPVPGTGGRSLP